MTVSPTYSPVPFITSDVLIRRYPELCRDVDPLTLSEICEEATSHIEDITDRRLAPFQGLLYQDMLRGINPNEYGGNFNDMPLDFAGSLGASYANALGSSDLVRHFWLDQFAPKNPELWTYNINSITINLTFGNTTVLKGAALIDGPDATDGHCFVPGTRVLTGALEWVPIESIQVGDELVGIDETTEEGKRQYHASTVEGTDTFELPCYEVEFDDGTIVTCSDDHLWFVKVDGQFFWRRTDQLVTPDGPKRHPTLQPSQVVRPFITWEHDTSNDAGYLAAAFDGEGSLFQAKATAVPVRITPVGVQEVVALQTSTKTYFAEGFVAHNCWLRMGTFAPEGSRVEVNYDGGFTVAVPSSLKRACIYQAAKFLILEAEPQQRKGMDVDELDKQIMTLLAPWARA